MYKWNPDYPQFLEHFVMDLGNKPPRKKIHGNKPPGSLSRLPQHEWE